MLTQLFDEQSTNATGSVIVEHNGGEVEVIVDGTFGGGTVTLMANFDEVGWVPVKGGEWTTPEVRILRTVRKCQLRLDLAGATSPSISAWI